ncbi:MAG: hypothetical protein GQ542_20475 [Desulforhopalus sp.]|nr:hypothetical protein [Desulforhopalus sp.]
MSRRGTCSDNAPMDIFWGMLKTEFVYDQKKCAIRQEAEIAIREYRVNLHKGTQRDT